MPEFPLEPSSYLEVVGVETERLANVAAGCLDATVPSCPAWVVAELLSHVGRVQRRVAVRVRGEEAPNVAIPAPDVRVAWLRDGAAILIAALRAVGPDAPCDTLDGTGGSAAFWYRRAAHEVTIHRVDAELAASQSITAIDPVLAADGIDEVLTRHLGRWLSSNPVPGLSGRVIFAPNDVDARWTVELREAGVVVDATEAPATVARGQAMQLEQFLWNRLPAQVLSIRGDPSPLENWAKQIRM